MHGHNNKNIKTLTWYLKSFTFHLVKGKSKEGHYTNSK